jgi:hypothetical protein
VHADAHREKFKSERLENSAAIVTRRDEFGRDVPVSPTSQAAATAKSSASSSSSRNRSRSPRTRHRSRSPHASSSSRNRSRSPPPSSSSHHRSSGEHRASSRDEWGTEFSGSRGAPPSQSTSSIPRGMDPGRAALLGLTGGPPPHGFGGGPPPPHFMMPPPPPPYGMPPYAPPQHMMPYDPNWGSAGQADFRSPPDRRSTDRARDSNSGDRSRNSNGSSSSSSASASKYTGNGSGSSYRSGGRSSASANMGSGGGGYGDDTRATRPAWTELPPLRTYRQFVLTQENGIDGDEAKRRYDIYKSEFTERITKQFFEAHKDDEWFTNKYHPERRGAARVEASARSRLAALQFGERLKSGALRWRLDADHADNAVFAPFLEHDNPQVRTPSELQLTAAAADVRAAALAAADLGGAEVDDEAAQRALDAVGAAYSRDMERRTVFVKALPSSTTRAALDELFRSVDGLERLALSEPSLDRMQRRAWATFSTLAGAQRAADQFANHALQLPNGATVRLSVQLLTPHRVRVRVVPPALSLPERIERDVAAARRLVEKLDGEKGLWPAPASADGADVELAGGGDDDASVGSKRALVAPKRLPLERHPLFSDAAAFDARPLEEQLDLLVSYLRRVHFFCFYTATEFDSDVDLERARGPIHLRFGSKRAQDIVQQQAAAAALAAADATGAAAAGEAAAAVPTLPGVPEADVKWMKSLDERLDARLAASDLPDAMTAATLLTQQLAELVDNNSEQLDDTGKHQCKVCPNKVFKEKLFVEKHIFNKHQDMVDQVRLAALIEQSRLNYLADPFRLRPEERGADELNSSLSTALGNNNRGGGGGGGGGTPGGGKFSSGRLGPPRQAPPGARVDPRSRFPPRVYTDLDMPAKKSEIDYGFD